MKTQIEIERAHDLLVGFLNLVNEAVGSGQDPDNPDDIALMIASADVLCWILGHENERFASNLVELEAMLFGKGIVLTDHGELCPDGEERQS